MNIGALVGDIGGLFAPFFTGGGHMVRAQIKADRPADATRTVRHSDNVPPLVRIADGCSFAAETPVAMAHGSLPISDIEAGDEVLAWDEKYDETDTQAVLKSVIHTDQLHAAVTIDGETIRTTPDHLFRTKHGWRPAAQLREGSAVMAAGGTTGRVEGIRFELREAPMWDLDVAVADTYFVGDGQWLVHNCPAPSRFVPDSYYSSQLKEHAPITLPPYSVHIRYRPDGRIHQVTTYASTAGVRVSMNTGHKHTAARLPRFRLQWQSRGNR